MSNILPGPFVTISSEAKIHDNLYYITFSINFYLSYLSYFSVNFINDFLKDLFLELIDSMVSLTNLTSTK